MNQPLEKTGSHVSNRNRGEITVEFFGVPRRRAGVAGTVLEMSSEKVLLADLLTQLAAQFPGFADCLSEKQELRKEYVVNVDGDRFLSGGSEVISVGQTVLILSSDAGG